MIPAVKIKTKPKKIKVMFVFTNVKKSRNSIEHSAIQFILELNFIVPEYTIRIIDGYMKDCLLPHET
jgi:hypothetical protein